MLQVNKRQVIILGGGISGLSLRYHLSQQSLESVLLEKNARLGGLIASQNAGGFFFERGPRTFKASKSHALLKLICELGLEKEILVSRKQSARRYIWKEGHLHPLSLRSPLVRKLLPALWKERKQKPLIGDETIFNFAKRRMGLFATETFFDPMALGIYAGDIRKLSVSSCFPKWKDTEQTYGSLTKGFLSKKKKPPFPYPTGMRSSSLFTLKEGVQSLVSTLEAKGIGEIHLETPAETVSFEGGKVVVESQGKTWEADHLYCALSASGAMQLTQSWDPDIVSFFHSLESVSLSVVQLGFSSRVLKEEGFGYLIPSSEGEIILGVIFDSSVFPLQNQREEETRLTVMMGGAHHPHVHQMEDAEKIIAAVKGIQKHLDIGDQPTWTNVIDYPHAIPQLTVGHRERVKTFREAVRDKYPQVTFLGNYLDGVAINDCVQVTV